MEIVGVIVGGVLAIVGGFLSFWWQSRHSRRQMLSDKLEELLLSTELYVSSLNSYFFQLEAVMLGHLTIDKMDDLDQRRPRPDVPPYTKLQTIVNLFFPELQDALSKLHVVRSECIAAFGPYRAQYLKVGHHEHSLIERFRDAVERFHVAADMLRQGIVSESNKITGVSSKYKSISHYSKEA